MAHTGKDLLCAAASFSPVLIAREVLEVTLEPGC